MTLTEANAIWFDCYQSDDLTLWGNYTDAQRRQAIQVRQDAHDAENGQWGIWTISDRD